MSPQDNLSHRLHACALFILLLPVLWLALAPAAAMAAPAERAAVPADRAIQTGVAGVSIQGAPAEIRLSDLYFVDQLLNKSGDEARVAFGLPASWRIAAGAALRLHFTTTLIGWEATPDRPTTLGRF